MIFHHHALFNLRNVPNHALIAIFSCQPILMQTIISATFKNTPTDFIVTEQLCLDFDGFGEHLWLYVEKINLNTHFVARLLADWAGIPIHDVGYSGMKDRHAQTFQWFSLRLPNKQPPQKPFNDIALKALKPTEYLALLQQHWHGKKLNRGTHAANHFTITLTKVVGDKDAIEQQLTDIINHGVPNYVGEQRFGQDGNNLSQARAFFQKLLDNPKPYKPFKKDFERHGILISSARSHLFNEILTLRVADGTWNQAIDGDVFNLDGTGSIFTSKIDDAIIERLKRHDIHPTIALFGIGENKASQSALAVENAIFQDEKNSVLIKGLEKVKAKMLRRPTRLIVRNLSWKWKDDALTLSFVLPKGSFATVVLDAMVAHLHQPKPQHSPLRK